MSKREDQYKCLECNQIFNDSEFDEDADCLSCPKCHVCYTQPAYSMPVRLGEYKSYPKIKMFTIEQVEEIVREAWTEGNNFQLDLEAMPELRAGIDPRDTWWQRKKQELVK